MSEKKDDKREENREGALKSAIAQIEKSYGKGAIQFLDGNRGASVDGISTGALSLDIALGGRGVPRGRVIEVFGPESSGKTTLTLHLIAEAQRAGGAAAFIDAEHAFDPSWAKRIGVNLEELMVNQPNSGEEALEICELLVRSNAIDVVVVDSVAALVPKQELEGQMGDSMVGVQARLMSQAMRKLTAVSAKSRTCIVFINQIREKIGVMYGSPETTPGGRALKFYSSVRIDIRRIGQIKDGEAIIGNRTRAKVVKNKIAPPFRETEFDILYECGISTEADTLDVATQAGIVQRQGTWYAYGEMKLGQGRDNARQFLRDNRETFHQIRKAVLTAHEATLVSDQAKTARPAEHASDDDESGEKSAAITNGRAMGTATAKPNGRAEKRAAAAASRKGK